MNTIKKQMIEIKQLCNESDGIYNDIAQNYGLSDSVYWILYIPVSYTHLDVYKRQSIRKQQIPCSAPLAGLPSLL